MARPRNAAAALAQAMADDGFPLPEAEIPAAPRRTPARQRLADAIAAVAETEAEIVATNAAVSEAETVYYASLRAFDDAEKVLARSRPREDSFTPASRPRGAFWGGQVDYEAAAAEAALPPVPIADAKAAAETARDAKDSAKALVQHHRDRLGRLESNIRFKRMNVPDAVREVVREDPAIAALAAECRRAVTRAASAKAAFNAATGGDTMQPGGPFYRCTEPADAHDGPAAKEDWRLSREWRNALDALASDPDVPLPMP